MSIIDILQFTRIIKAAKDVLFISLEALIPLRHEQFPPAEQKNK